MHEPAVSHRGEQDWKRKIESEHRRAKIAIRKGDCVPRPESYVVEDPAILAKRDLALGAAVEIIEHRSRQSLARDRPEIVDANNPG